MASEGYPPRTIQHTAHRKHVPRIRLYLQFEYGPLFRVSHETSIARGFCVSQEKPRGIDIATCLAFPLTLVGFVLVVGFSHTAAPPWSRLLFILGAIAVILVFVLPVWVLFRVVFDKGRTPISVLWLESVMAGCLLLFDLCSGVSELPRPWWVVGVVIAGAASIALGLTPYLARSIR
jgi:hypothetical protein